jgi:diadenosine tetraphosphate (Ap4A) HIT family hydrolase
MPNHPVTSDNPECPFCLPDLGRTILAETALAYAIYDKFPVNTGHVLIIPKRHVADYFALSLQEQVDCLTLLNQVRDIIVSRFHPDAFNIGVNIGIEAGQTVHHVHIHLIPRYQGDVEDPRGGVRGVIPDKRLY